MKIPEEIKKVMDFASEKKEIEENFNKIKKELEKMQEMTARANQELLRLQGEYRLIEKLEKEPEKKEEIKEENK